MAVSLAAGAQTVEATPAAETNPTEASPLEVMIVGVPARRVAGSAHVIQKAELERFEYDDPHAVLQSVPGVYVRGEDGVGLRPNVGLRGVNPDRSKKLALYEDGVPFAPAPYSAPAAYYFPVLTRMHHLRIVKGPSAISYGPQTVGGAMELITRPIPANAEGSADVAAGEFGYGKAHGYFGSSDGKSGFLVEGVHLMNSGFKELPSGADTGAYRNEWMFKSSYAPNPSAADQSEFTLKLTYSDEVSNETYLGLTDSDFRKFPDRRYAASQLDRMAWHRFAVALKHEFVTLSGVKVRTLVYRQDMARTWRKLNGFRGAQLFDVTTTPDTPQNQIFAELLRGTQNSGSPTEGLLIGPNQRELASQGIETRVQLAKVTGPVHHDLEYAARLHNDRVERRHSEDGFVFVDGRLLPDATPTVVTAFNEAESSALALHAVDKATWGELTLTPGARLEVVRSIFRDRTSGEQATQLTHAILPGVGAFLSLSDAFGVLSGVHRGFSPPAPSLERQVSPEFSVNYEAGGRFIEGATRLELIGFYNDYSNLTEVCTFSSGCRESDLDQQVDAGQAAIYGAEVYLGATPAAGEFKVPMSLAYTVTRTEFLRAFASSDPIFGTVEVGDEIPYVPRHQASASLGLEQERFGAAAHAVFVSRMREQAGSAPLSEVLSTDEQFTVDFSGYYQIHASIKLYANLRNAFDQRAIVSRRPYGARPNAPRWTQVGIKADF
ncbi:MAG: TonB-dependent receptor [Polyangiaceae bacterium]|nr:TonB-dependent receptor [Polyangiaceae bacterium]